MAINRQRNKIMKPFQHSQNPMTYRLKSVKCEFCNKKVINYVEHIEKEHRGRLNRQQRINKIVKYWRFINDGVIDNDMLRIELKKKLVNCKNLFHFYKFKRKYKIELLRGEIIAILDDFEILQYSERRNKVKDISIKELE